MLQTNVCVVDFIKRKFSTSVPEGVWMVKGKGTEYFVIIHRYLLKTTKVKLTMFVAVPRTPSVLKTMAH